VSRRAWIVVFVALGVVLALVIGFAARSQSTADTQFCSSLESLKSSVSALTSLDAGTASQGDFQSAVSDVQSDWDSLVTADQNLHNANMASLQSAWSSFEQAVKGIPSDASASTAQSDVKQSADALESAVESAISSHQCSS
jgi:hypothetical protein